MQIPTILGFVTNSEAEMSICSSGKTGVFLFIYFFYIKNVKIILGSWATQKQAVGRLGHGSGWPVPSFNLCHFCPNRLPIL